MTSTTIGVGNLTVAPTGTISFVDTTNDSQTLATSPIGAAISALTFSATSPFSIGDATNPSLAADFNNDGKIDLAVADLQTLSVVLGVGDGTFMPSTAVSTGITGFLAAGDFNSDGNIDLLVSNAAGGAPSILLGNGNGTFTAAAGNVGTATPFAVAADDFNGDGIVDLAVVTTGFGSDILTVYQGSGDGTFTALSSTYTLGRGSGLSAADFNGDGKVDILSIASDSSVATLYLGNGDGTFSSGPSPNGLEGVGDAGGLVGDVNGDGFDDVIVTGPYPFEGSQVFLGNGDATFRSAPNLPITGSEPFALGDFNADGKVDIVLGGGSSVLLGNGDGTFSSTPVVQNEVPAPSFVAVADLNGDGISDILTLQEDGFSSVLSRPTETVAATASQVAVLGTGNHAVLASYSGDSSYDSSVSATTSVGAQIATYLTLAPVNSSDTNVTAFQGQPIPITATLAPASVQGQSTDGELITFYGADSNSAVVNLGTAKLFHGVATINITFPQLAGYSVTGGYGGDAAFSATTSSAIGFTVHPTPAVGAGFVSGEPMTVAQTGSATDPIQLDPSDGYGGDVSLVCSNLPPNATCSLSPSTVTFAFISGHKSLAERSTTLTLNTGTAAQTEAVAEARDSHGGRYGALAALCGFPGLMSLVVLRRRKALLGLRTAILTTLLLGVFCAGFTACSGGSSGGSSGTKTPSVAYTVQLFLTGPSGLSQTTNLKVVVQ